MYEPISTQCERLGVTGSRENGRITPTRREAESDVCFIKGYQRNMKLVMHWFLYWLSKCSDNRTLSHEICVGADIVLFAPLRASWQEFSARKLHAVTAWVFGSSYRSEVEWRPGSPLGCCTVVRKEGLRRGKQQAHFPSPALRGDTGRRGKAASSVSGFIVLFHALL